MATSYDLYIGGTGERQTGHTRAPRSGVLVRTTFGEAAALSTEFKLKLEACIPSTATTRGWLIM